MKTGSSCVVMTLVFCMAIPLVAQDEPQPVRMGCGMMTFDTVPGWGLRPDGNSALGSTHGAVVIDKAGNIYTSAKKGVVVGGIAGAIIGD